MSILLEAAQARSVGARDVTARPSQRRHAADPTASAHARVCRAFEVRAADTASPIIEGFASVTGISYEMYDMFGPYTELVAVDAFDKTLATEPLVEFTLNHGAGGGIPMAHTRNGTLTLSVIKDAEETGLWYAAAVDPTRYDVSDVMKATKRRDLAESSFKFMIVRGQWSPDWTEYHILEIDIHRGDVSAVNFGANPHTSTGVREAQQLAARVAFAADDTARRILISEADTQPRSLA